jgi:hypothetical protein
LAVLLVTLSYLGLCTISPFGTCRKCNGLGFHLLTARSGKPKRGADCRRCKGAGARIRIGRRLLNLLARLRRDDFR